MIGSAKTYATKQSNEAGDGLIVNGEVTTYVTFQTGFKPFD